MTTISTTWPTRNRAAKMTAKPEPSIDLGARPDVKQAGEVLARSEDTYRAARVRLDQASEALVLFEQALAAGEPVDFERFEEAKRHQGAAAAYLQAATQAVATARDGYRTVRTAATIDALRELRAPHEADARELNRLLMEAARVNARIVARQEGANDLGGGTLRMSYLPSLEFASLSSNASGTGRFEAWQAHVRREGVDLEADR